MGAPHDICWSKSYFSFFFLVTEKYKKLDLMQKQMISTSDRRAEHLFTGQNTQQIWKDYRRFPDWGLYLIHRKMANRSRHRSVPVLPFRPLHISTLVMVLF